MREIVTEIEEAVQQLHLPNDSFVKCDPSKASDVVQRAKNVFVSDNPRVWWLSLKYPKSFVSFPQCDGSQHVTDYIPTTEKRCWFIPETGKAALPVFDVQAKVVSAVLGECSFFEYYLVGKTFEWLIIENDHNEVIVTHATME